jgi:hypothetical protein
MLHRNAEPRLTTVNNVVAIRPLGAPEQLERRASKPLMPRRHELRMLAERLRALDALDDAHDQQLILSEVA